MSAINVPITELDFDPHGKQGKDRSMGFDARTPDGKRIEFAYCPYNMAVTVRIGMATGVAYAIDAKDLAAAVYLYHQAKQEKK